jgi:hypothetical protein
MIYRNGQYNPIMLRKNITGTIIANFTVFIMAVAVTVLFIVLDIYTTVWYAIAIMWITFFIVLVSSLVSNHHKNIHTPKIHLIRVFIMFRKMQEAEKAMDSSTTQTVVVPQTNVVIPNSGMEPPGTEMIQQQQVYVQQQPVYVQQPVVYFPQQEVVIDPPGVQMNQYPVQQQMIPMQQQQQVNLTPQNM